MKRCNDNSWFQNQLDSFDINIWVVELHRPALASNLYWKTLSPDEKNKAVSFKTTQLQKKYVVARGSLRYLLGSYLNMPPNSIQFTYNKQGKPTLENQDRIFFNLSHSKDLAMIAFSKIAEVGIDLEHMDFSVDFSSLSKLVMTHEEQAEFQSLAKHKQTEIFFTLWTRKEAFVKGLGLGLQFDLKNFFVGLHDQPQLKLSCGSNLNYQQWLLKDIQLKDKTFKAAVAFGKDALANYSIHYSFPYDTEQYH